MLRIVGAGAVDAVSRWVAAHGVTEAVAFPTLPSDTHGALWLHDAPGSRYLADGMAAKCTFDNRPWILLLTGRAVDGAHPVQGETIAIDSTGGGGAAVPTQVVLELPVDPHDALARWAHEGDLARAHACFEHLADRDAASMAPWCWLEVRRLANVGRIDEVEALGLTLPNRQACRARILLEMASAMAEAARSARALSYLDALESGPHDEAEARDATFLRAVVQRDVDAIEASEPASGIHRAARRRILHVLGRSSAEPRPPGRLAAAYERFDVDEPIDALIEVGALLQAATRHRIAGPENGSVYLVASATEARVASAMEAGRVGDIAELERILDSLDDELEQHRARTTYTLLVLRARVASHRGAVGALLSCVARLRALRGSLWIDVAALDAYLPAAGEGADAWCTETYLRLLDDHTKGASPDLERAFEAQPTVPVVLGPYVLDRVLASGGMGTVWEGRHRLTGRPVAVKVLDGATPDQVELFRAEIDVVARFDHPMIVSVLDLLEVDARVEQQSGGVLRSGQPALVMELVEHGTLADHVGRLGWSDIQAALVGVLEALAYAHAHGVVHRDLKPQNILVGEGHALRLADFGLAGLDPEKIGGTPAYMAPEQFRAVPVEPVADVYAVGCIGWTLACGMPPFIGSARQVAAAHRSAPFPQFEPTQPLPPAFEVWLHRCLRKDPSARFPSAAAAAESLLAIDGATGMLPGRSPVVPYHPGSSTFVLQTLLDLPEAVFEPAEEGTATRRLHDIFEDRASWRPRIPTERMLHRGDPPILFQRATQRELWTHLMGVLSGRTQRISLHGQGARSLLRWLRRRARIAGLDVHEEPVPGKVSIVDVTGRSPDDLPTSRHERWLLVWREQEVPGARRVDLAPLHPGALWWLVYSRILLHPHTACQVALQAVGSPAIAFALVDDWLEAPGVEMTPFGLRLLHEPTQGARRATELWRAVVSDAPPEALRVAQLMAIKPFPATDRFLRAMLPPDLELRLAGMAIVANDAWQMPPDLQAVVLETLDPGETRALHLRSAEREGRPLARAVHGCLANPDLENTLALVQATQGLRLPPALLDVVQIHIDSHLLEVAEVRTCFTLRRASDAQLGLRVWDPDPRIADLARIELFDRVLPWPEGLTDRMEREALRPRPPVLAIRLAHVLTDQLGRVGRLDDALLMLERLEAQLEGAPGHDPNHLAWVRARCLRGEAAVETYRAALDGAGPELQPSVHIDLADELLRMRRYEEALHHVDQSRGHWSVAADYNRAVALVALGRDAEAARITNRATTLAVRTSPRVYIGLVFLELALNLDEPTPMWEALSELCVIPLRDSTVHEVLTRRLESVPGTRRTDQLRSLMRLPRMR